jgi:polyisoprenoid-binding protein YceI
MKTIIILFSIMALAWSARAQKYVTKTGHIWFYSDAPLEKIEAHNHQVNAAVDFETGDMVFKVLIKSFEFEKALMQEHFNENYLESDKFPNATFEGKVINLKEVKLTSDGSYDVDINGTLTIHGVAKEVKEKGSFTVDKGMLKGKAKFTILLTDYNINIPNTVINNISKTIEINVDIQLEKLDK